MKTTRIDKFTHRAIFGTYALGFSAALVLACIIPDKDIVVLRDCGNEWLFQTPGAQGLNGQQQEEDILIDDLYPVSLKLCLDDDEHEDMFDDESDEYINNMAWIVASSRRTSRGST